MPPRKDHHTSRRVSRYTLVAGGPPMVYRLPRASPEIFTSVSAESRTPPTGAPTDKRRAPITVSPAGGMPLGMPSKLPAPNAAPPSTCTGAWENASLGTAQSSNVQVAANVHLRDLVMATAVYMIPGKAGTTPAFVCRSSLVALAVRCDLRRRE